MSFRSGGDSNAKVWKDIWDCGQAIGAVKNVAPNATVVDRLAREYAAARTRLSLAAANTLRRPA